MSTFFFSIGFSIVEGPEIETPYYNFEAPEHSRIHPVARRYGYFYLILPKRREDAVLLRTHTRHAIRTMEKQKPPCASCSRKVYRRDNPDATHSSPSTR